MVLSCFAVSLHTHFGAANGKSPNCIPINLLGVPLSVRIDPHMMDVGTVTIKLSQCHLRVEFHGYRRRICHFFWCHTLDRGHISERPMMSPQAIQRGNQKRLVAVVRGFMYFVNERGARAINA